MSDMKCPFCNLDIRSHRIYLDGCDNTRSPLWQELIKLREENERTRKALGVAVDALKHYCTDSDNWSCVIDFTGDYDNTPSEFADKALEQITALTKGGDNE